MPPLTILGENKVHIKKLCLFRYWEGCGGSQMATVPQFWDESIEVYSQGFEGHKPLV